MLPALLGTLLSSAASSGGGGGAGGGMMSKLGGGVQLIPAAFKFFQGLKQAKEARAINPLDPGYQMNTETLDNARILGNHYNNYELPGSGQVKSDLNAGYTQAFDQGALGASSGGDVLDLASKLAYGQGKNINQLGVETAQGKENTLSALMNAKTAAGNELVGKNAYDRDQYTKKLAEKAALVQASKENEFGAIDSAAGALGTALRSGPSSTPTLPAAGIDPGMFAKLAAANKSKRQFNLYGGSQAPDVTYN